MGRDTTWGGFFADASAFALAGAIMLAVAAGGMIGCSYMPDKDHRGGTERMSLEQARTALIRLIESMPEGVVRNTLEAVKAQTPQDADGERVTFGPWECDLSRRTFALVIAAPPLFALYEGKFVPVSEGEWRAVITRTAQN